MTGLGEKLRALLSGGEPAALVRIAAAKGSAPREAGSAMIVTADASFGTVGGGRLEWEAMAAARRLLEQGEAAADMALPLGPALGQCCGGHVALRIERADDETLAWLEAAERRERETLPPVLLFGAGHVGTALAGALAPLPLRLRWIDSRPGALPAEPPPGVETATVGAPVDEVAAAPPQSAYIVMTHSHDGDYELVEAILRRGDFRYAGLIGSASKRRSFERRFLARGGAKARWAQLVCPIGGGHVADKRPAVIAALTAAEVLEYLYGAGRADAVGAADKGDGRGGGAWQRR